jgi:hypothetical protein
MQARCHQCKRVVRYPQQYPRKIFAVVTAYQLSTLRAETRRRKAYSRPQPLSMMIRRYSSGCIAELFRCAQRLMLWEASRWRGERILAWRAVEPILVARIENRLS